MKIAYIISYDIANERRLNRIHNYLKGQGVHLQKSVFYCLLSRERLKKIQDDLQQKINNSVDDIRIYPLVANFKPIILGQGDRVPEGIWVYLD